MQVYVVSGIGVIVVDCDVIFGSVVVFGYDYFIIVYCQYWCFLWYCEIDVMVWCDVVGDWVQMMWIKVRGDVELMCCWEVYKVFCQICFVVVVEFVVFGVDGIVIFIVRVKMYVE